MDELLRLKEIMDTLRSENGCNWDKKQTRSSLVPFLLEETYEVVDAIASNDPEHIKEELGDLLFNIFFQARIAEENHEFTIHEVAKDVSDKLVRRHPHVFDTKQDLPPDKVLENWESIKKTEKKNKITSDSILTEVPTALPSLLYAEKLQNKASKVGFDWKDSNGPLSKVKEELAELENEMNHNSSKIEEELGDLLFSIVNLSRFFEISPEKALRDSCNKFKSRFQYIERTAKQNKNNLENMNLEEMDTLWNRAKTLEKK